MFLWEEHKLKHIKFWGKSQNYPRFRIRQHTKKALCLIAFCTERGFFSFFGTMMMRRDPTRTLLLLLLWPCSKEGRRAITLLTAPGEVEEEEGSPPPPRDKRWESVHQKVALAAELPPTRPHTESQKWNDLAQNRPKSAFCADILSSFWKVPYIFQSKKLVLLSSLQL